MPSQAQAYFADGTPIPAAELPRALAEGKAHFEADAQVLVRDADGRAGVVSGADVGQLLASGGGLETPETLAAEDERREGVGARQKALDNLTSPVQQYLGYQEAIARGATLGLSDLALTEGLGDEYRQGAQARAANPLTALPELAGAGGALVAGEMLAGPAGGAAGAARATGALGRLAEVVTAPGRALGAAGRAGEALGAPLGTFGRLAGRGVAEGALAGAGAEVSAASLEDRDLTVDKLLASAGYGAVMGGGLNVATGGATRLLGAAGRSVLGGMGEGQGLGDAIASFGRKRAFKATSGNAVRAYNEATNFGQNPERLERIGQKLLDDPAARALLNDPIEAERYARTKLEATGQQLRAIADQLDAQGTRVDPRPILGQVDEQVARLRNVGLPDFDNVARRVERTVGKLRSRAAAGEDYGFNELWQLRRNFDKTIKWASDARNPAAEELKRLRGIIDDALDDATAKPPPRPTLSEEETKRLLSKFEEHKFGTFRSALEMLKHGDVPASEWKYLRSGMREESSAALRKAYASGLDPNDIATGRVTPPGSKAPLPPLQLQTDSSTVRLVDGRHRLEEALANGATEIRAKVQTTGEFHRLGPDAAEEVIIPIARSKPASLDDVARHPMGPEFLRAEYPKLDVGKLTAPATPPNPALQAAWLKAKEDFSDFRIVRDALQRQNIRNEKNRWLSASDNAAGLTALLSAVVSGGSALAALATAAATGAVHKQLREKGPGAIARIADTISKLDKRTNKAIAAAIDGKPGDLPELPKRTVPLLAALEAGEGEATLRTASKERDRYERTLRLVRDIASPSPSPEAITRLGNATLSLSEDFPELASLLHQRVIAAAQALNARAPVPLRKPNPLQPHLEESRVPAGLIAKWLREVDALETPESIWHDMARGRVPREKIELLKETQPYLWEDWRGRVMRVVAERGEKLSRPQRIRLSLAFDFTGDPSVDPVFISQVQSEYAAMRAQQAQPNAPSGGADINPSAAEDMKPPTEQSLLATG